MPRFVDLTGLRFGRLVVIERAENKGNRTRWLCKCDCGNMKNTCSSQLVGGRCKSCGCYQKQRAVESNITHGLTGTKLLSILKSMVQRCTNPNAHAYKNYGGRGISVCDEWLNSPSAFVEWAKQNGYKNWLTIDRIDNNGNYCPENCRWADRLTQANNSRKNKKYEYKGSVYTASQLASMSSVSSSTIARRIKQGMSVVDAVETPSNIQKRSG